MVTLKLWCSNTPSNASGAGDCASGSMGSSDGGSSDKGRFLPAFEVLGAEWVGRDIQIPFGADRKRAFDVAGWSDHVGGYAVSVHVVKAGADGRVGYLVYGGDGGVRILDQTAGADPEPTERFAEGRAAPLVWVVNGQDLPAAVQEVVERPICRRCGKELSPLDAQGAKATFCEQCQSC